MITKDTIMSDNFVGIILFISIAAVVSVFFLFRYRNRKEVQLTVRAAIEKGQELSPEVIERLGAPPAPKNRDLRRGIVALAFALAFPLFGLSIGEEEAIGPMFGIATFPLMLGVAFLLLHFFARRD